MKKWIEAGAIWDADSVIAPVASGAAAAALQNRPLTPDERGYWAFKLPVQAPIPVTDRKDFTSPIDRFLQQPRTARGLAPAPRADRLTLVRRAYLDLLGLPPSPDQVAAFIADSRPGAWERLIDNLLASPHYGERYGRHWLDVARYADSGGFEYDVHRPNAWRYRDYVIRSFNADKPYNVFLTEQIAADEMDGKTEDSLIATGFLRAGPRVLFREKDNPERRYDYLDEILGTIGKGTLGLTAPYFHNNSGATLEDVLDHDEAVDNQQAGIDGSSRPMSAPCVETRADTPNVRIAISRNRFTKEKPIVVSVLHSTYSTCRSARD